MILKYSKMYLTRLSAKCEATSHSSEQSLLKVNVEFEIMTCFYQVRWKKEGGATQATLYNVLPFNVGYYFILSHELKKNKQKA